MKEHTSNKEFLIAASPLFLIIFIDSMGLGLVFPLLNSIIIDPNSGFLPHNFSEHLRNIIFGITIGSFMIAWFFGASFLGDLSDQIGRKKSLAICLWGSFFGYLLSALGVSIESYWLMLLGRVIAGFTAGSQAIAQASIVDLSPQEHKARNLGYIFLAMSLGFIVGPLMGGILSDHTLVAWFNFAMPFYFAAVVAFLNIGLLYRYYKETFNKTGKIKIKLHHAIILFISAFRQEKVRFLSIILLVLVFGWGGFYSFISMFLLHVFGFTVLQVSLYMALMGMGFGVGNGLLVDPCTKRFSLKACVTVSLAIAAVGSLITVTSPSIPIILIAAFIMAIAISIGFASLLTIFSNQVDASSQGWVMGITGSIMAFAFGFNALVVGPLASLSPHVPLIISSTWLIISCLLMCFFQGNKKAILHSSLQQS